MPEAIAIVPAIVAISALFVLCIALHLWYAFGVSHVLAAHDLPTWRAWVPLVNEAEVFRLGRVGPEKAVLFLVPFVAVYALVLKAMAAHRIGAEYGRGAGTTVLAVLLPPVWATVLAGAERLPSTPVDDDDEDREPIVLVPGMTGAPAAPAPAALAVAPAPPAPPALGTISPSVFAPAPPPAAPLSAPPPAAAPAFAPAAPISAPPPAASAPASAPPAAAIPEAGPRRRRRTGEPDAAPAAAASAPAAAPDAPIEERTHIARGPRAWEIVLPAGEVVSLTARTVVLGRKPEADDATAQYIAVTDDTRTVSKQHAKLSWTGDGWAVTDLGSTNGVALVAADGAEQRLAAGASAPAAGVLLLGDARLTLRHATR